MNQEYIQLFNALKCCVIMPTYNNEGTVAQVIRDVLAYTQNLIVVVDGHGDRTLDIVQAMDGIDLIEYKKNRGKGFALRAAFKQAKAKGFDYAITIDADGQHYASDLPNFLAALQTKKRSIIIGSRTLNHENVPSKSTFGNKFSTFWFKLETGVEIPDTQSGYRLYPIFAMEENFLTNRFEFEIEVIVRSSWRGIAVEHIPVGVYYPLPEDRVSHFRPIIDFLRISVLNTVLVLLGFLYYIPKRLLLRYWKQGLVKTIKEDVLGADLSTRDISCAVGFGVFMGIVPIWGFQLMLGLFLCHLLKLNKPIFVVAANISIPPMIPILLYLSYLTGGLFFGGQQNLEEITGVELMFQPETILQYVVGAFLFAFVAGVISALLTYLIIYTSKRKHG